MSSPGCRICLIILAFFCPPLAVIFHIGCNADACINILLTFLLWIPGVIHAIWVIMTKGNDDHHHHHHDVVVVQQQPAVVATVTQPPPTVVYHTPAAQVQYQVGYQPAAVQYHQAQPSNYPVGGQPPYMQQQQQPSYYPNLNQPGPSQGQAYPSAPPVQTKGTAPPQYQ